jgi:isopenicillin N synthase-like dioxygenase
VPATTHHLPVIDLARPAASVSDDVDAACRRVGFFGIVGHGVDPALLDRLEQEARRFFALPDDTKSEIAMHRAGAAWRGWFPVGGELTDGRPDAKEGIYFGADHGPDHPGVVAGTPLHGRNQYPADPAGLAGAVDDWMAAMRPVAEAVLRAVATGLGLAADWFETHLTADPTVLFRIFHYPPRSAGWGVAEHTDYGLVTLLAQDDAGGLEVRQVDGSWTTIAPERGMLVCNLGDMLERFSGGVYRSTPHRVRNPSDRGRLSFPYFFDPSWDAPVPGLDVTYGDHLTAKVSRVFPELFVSAVGSTPRSPSVVPLE